MERKTFTLSDLRKSNEQATRRLVTLTRLHSRRKVNCVCRCHPKVGITAMHPDYTRSLYDEQMRYILSCRNLGHIADRALQTGHILATCGRPRLALKLMRTALKHLVSEEDNQQEDYARNHYYPGVQFAQWYQFWHERISEADARRLAQYIDEVANGINKQLGHNEQSHLRHRVRIRYQCMFHWIYE